MAMWFASRHRRRSRPADLGNRRTDRWARPESIDCGSPNGFRVQILYATEDRDHVVLDCVVSETDECLPVPPGYPFTIEVELPYTADWAAAAVECALQRWSTCPA